ncbi:hypothetical protein HDU93_002750 [Gonapodya sp. JEL0774]|nr:hypothetical protein HDU93_002750 [Gonapodya sp. JEL0774]
MSSYRWSASFVASLEFAGKKNRKQAIRPAAATTRRGSAKHPENTFYSSLEPTQFPSDGLPGIAHATVVVFSFALLIMWYAALLSTVLRFHTLGEKIWGAVFGLAWWAASYAGWTTSGSSEGWSLYRALGWIPGDLSASDWRVNGDVVMKMSTETPEGSAVGADRSSSTKVKNARKIANPLR